MNAIAIALRSAGNLALMVLTGYVTAFGAEAGNQDAVWAWPPTPKECRPWAYHWWLGSAVDKANLTKELQRYRDAGMGGVHIIPIYGVKGWETNFLEYLGPKWMEMLRHALAEGQRLDLGVDMTLGTGWCFGGPAISDRLANARVVTKTFALAAGEKLKEKLDPKEIQACVAFSAEGQGLELTDRLQADGTLDWTAPAGKWQVYAVSQAPSGRKVKRAAPGGEGHMLNTFYAEAIRQYLTRFTQAFAGFGEPMPRAFYHDSYEYDSNWSPDLFAQFEKRRGYRLQQHLPRLLGKDTSDFAARVKCDYRETISDLMVEHFMPAWVNWAHELGSLTRNQAHGSPGNLLDLYAAADIPETEMFNKDRDPLISKFASSAAHVAGRKLVAAETGTWLAEHFTETLGDMKRLVDLLFVAGVNHVIYHGTIYSPDEAPWPGWLFYASTEMNPRNSIWRDAVALNTYIARCQAVLQADRPANDILLYWPIHDLWHNPSGLARGLTVHARDWFHQQPVGALAELLWAKGYTFDYISDRQLAGARAKGGAVETPGGLCQVVLAPRCQHLPVETMEKLLQLAQNGATILFEQDLPSDVPGLASLPQRQAKLRELTAPLKFATLKKEIRQAPHGKGRVLVGQAEACLAAARIAPEMLANISGLVFIRRATDDGHVYFLANQGDQVIDQWLPLSCAAEIVMVMDPMSGQMGLGAARQTRDGKARVYVQLQPNQSIFLSTINNRDVQGPAWAYWKAAGQPVELTGNWQISYLTGGPELPKPYNTQRLASWTESGDPESQRFAGTAQYRLIFDAPDAGAAFRLDLGRVCQSARVRLNGRNLGTLFAAPFQVIAESLKAKDNLLEIEVTNVSANRIRDLDRRGVKWKYFYDINLVNLNYRPFDASAWPLYDSGLLGPVTLVKVEKFNPD